MHRRRACDGSGTGASHQGASIECAEALIEGRPVVCEQEWCTGFALVDDWLHETNLESVACREMRVKVGIYFRLGGHKFGKVVRQEPDWHENVLNRIEAKIRRKSPGGEPFLVKADKLREAVGRWAARWTWATSMRATVGARGTRPPSSRSGSYKKSRDARRKAPGTNFISLFGRASHSLRSAGVRNRSSSAGLFSCSSLHWVACISRATGTSRDGRTPLRSLHGKR